LWAPAAQHRQFFVVHEVGARRHLSVVSAYIIHNYKVWQMALLIETFEDLVHIIETNPEWRRRLKRSLFDIDIEAALTRLEAAIEALVTIQRQQGADITELKGDVSDLKTGMARLDGRVARLDGRVAQIENDVAVLKGKSYEHDYRLKADAIFGRFIRRGRNYTNVVADQLHDAAAAGTVSPQEVEGVLLADLLWGGRSRLDAEDDVLVVLEASWLAKEVDVTRAHQRATTLRRIGFHVVPVVAGAVWDEQALALADSLAVVIATNGQVNPDSWQKALMAPHPPPD
jgi:hypothetical protein